jgi:hypothetical protein
MKNCIKGLAGWAFARRSEMVSQTRRVGPPSAGRVLPTRVEILPAFLTLLVTFGLYNGYASEETEVLADVALRLTDVPAARRRPE